MSKNEWRSNEGSINDVDDADLIRGTKLFSVLA
jgi:hypothetical protein